MTARPDYRLERQHAPVLLMLGMTYLEVMDCLGISSLDELENICRRACGAHPTDVRMRSVRAEVRRLLRRMDEETAARVAGVSVSTLRVLRCA